MITLYKITDSTYIHISPYSNASFSFIFFFFTIQPYIKQRKRLIFNQLQCNVQQLQIKVPHRNLVFAIKLYALQWCVSAVIPGVEISST